MTLAARYRKAQRLRGRRFAQVLRGGRTQRAGAVSVQTLSNGLEYPRLGLVIPKSRLPRSVDRSRAKRLLREWFRCNQARLGGCDVVVRVTMAPQALTSLRADLDRALAGRS